MPLSFYRSTLYARDALTRANHISPPHTRAPCSFSGTTLFTGVSASITIHPVHDSRGIRFRRIDLPGSPPIPADVAHVIPESRHTVLSANPADKAAPTIRTTEHLISALAGLGITDAIIDLAGPEIPIGDGSASPFVDAIAGAGIAPVDQPLPHIVVVVSQPITIESGSSRIVAQPTPPHAPAGLELTYILEYPPGGPIPAQRASLFVPLGAAAPEYAAQIAPARTFSPAAEAEAMRDRGLFKHLSPREMLVIGDRGPIDNAYRFDNEPARHKLLDLLGDLALVGRPINARITATRTGHAHNHAMARALAAI